MRLFQRFTYLLFIGTLTFWLIVSCAQNNTPPNQNQSQENCRMIQHAMDDACIPNRPERLITLNPAALGNAIALGIQPIGSIFEHNNRFPTYLGDKTNGIEPIGDWSQPNIERIALIEPDIIIGWQHNNESIYPQLSAIAPTVLYDWHGGNAKQDNWKQHFNFMAEVLNRKEVGEQVWQHYNQRIEQLKAALGDRYKDKTISFVNFCCGGINSETENSFVGSVLSDAGLQRPPSQGYNPQGYINFSEETLDMADGDVMFVVAYGGEETGERDLSRIQQTPLWKHLKAVQNNRVYYVDPTTWRGRTPLAADAVIDDLFKYLVNKS